MVDKRMGPDDVVGRLRSGMTIGVGGWGSRRKPMALVRAILRSEIDDLTVVSHGGPDVGMLCAAGKVRRLVFAFVSLDTIPLEPHYRNARETGSIECTELDEGMVLLGLQAAAWRVPFLPTRVGLGSDLFRVNPELRTVRSPYPSHDLDGGTEELVAVPALRLDAALCHLNRADARGNAQFLGPDPYFDDLMIEAADASFVSCERIVDTADLAKGGCVHTLRVNRLFVEGVIEAPNGAHPTSCDPDYGRDEDFQQAYAASAKSAEAWAGFRAEWLDLEEADYQDR
jgi:glutaconate CoA-transferase subunit A